MRLRGTCGAEPGSWICRHVTALASRSAAAPSLIGVCWLCSPRRGLRAAPLSARRWGGNGRPPGALRWRCPGLARGLDSSKSTSCQLALVLLSRTAARGGSLGATAGRTPEATGARHGAAAARVGRAARRRPAFREPSPPAAATAAWAAPAWATQRGRGRGGPRQAGCVAQPVSPSLASPIVRKNAVWLTRHRLRTPEAPPGSMSDPFGARCQRVSKLRNSYSSNNSCSAN